MAICTLALHATAAHRDAAAASIDEASSDLVVDDEYHYHGNNSGVRNNSNNNSNNVSRRRRKHVRRRGMERGRHDDDRIDGRGSGYPRRRRREERHDDYGRELSTACSNEGYHPITNNKNNNNGCTNDDVFPATWLSHPSLKSRMFYSNAADCCRNFFMIPDCPVVDVCAGGRPPPPLSPTPANSPGNSGNSNPGPSHASGSSSSSASSCKWHVALKTQDGCANDDDYPLSWLDANRVGHMFFDTAEACCVRMFPGVACKQHNRGCSRSSSGGSTPNGGGGGATQANANSPADVKKANSPANSTANAKANSPANSPADVPADARAKMYWVKETTGACVEDADDPKPHWIKTWHSSYEACCPHAQDSIACMASLPAAPVAP
eukprot:CAMPEP_0181101084 /NCGR_PEP_ID=MMETSP1071-20121207/13557_1 /TAXON_ID=35127 /ORGANISM="Thalassiosira sp., Strain NH16" /LENGTH=379 /DNA_ID=CAMNT_0023183895 /DNA_START=147 /DNA_END=1282 /DNA_ORIENTATION=-